VANRSYLLAVEDRSTTWSSNPEREIIAEGINEIPVFWASLFTPDNKQIDTYEGEDEEGNKVALEVANWCVSSDDAKQRLDTLRELVAELLDERSQEVWFAFVDHLCAEEAAYFKTNAVEFWELDPDGYDEYWDTLLRFFSKPTAKSLKAALEVNDLSYVRRSVSWDDDEETICKLAGDSHIRDVPWFDD
jgi:hypothetical protein